MNEELTRKQFERGVALMDSKLEDNWIYGVDPDTLDMSSAFKCVLGQFFGGYFEGREWLGIEYGMGHEYGFDTVYGQEGYNYLTSLWWNLLTERRNKA